MLKCVFVLFYRQLSERGVHGGHGLDEGVRVTRIFRKEGQHRSWNSHMYLSAYVGHVYVVI